MRLLAGSLVVLLAACSVGQQAADDAARSAAKGVITPIVEERLPGVPAAKVTDCIIDNASAGEILTLAKAAVIGVTPEATELVVSIGQRPETVQCIAKAVISV